MFTYVKSSMRYPYRMISTLYHTTIHVTYANTIDVKKVDKLSDVWQFAI